MKHSSSQSRKGVAGHSYLGENLAYGAIDKKGVDLWYDEIKLTPGGKGTISGFTKGTGHYTQVVWKRTTELGCAVNGRLLVCQYGVGGNMRGQFTQNVNAPVKSSAQCPDGGGSGPAASSPSPKAPAPKDKYECYSYQSGQNDAWCQNAGAPYTFTRGNNANYPGCGGCWCCKEKGVASSPSPKAPAPKKYAPKPSPPPSPPASAGELKLRFAGDSGCLKYVGAKKLLTRNQNSGCARFKLDGKAFKSIDSTGQCLDYFGGRGFGLWSCHGGSNQQFTTQGEKWCSGSNCVQNSGSPDGTSCSSDSKCASGRCEGGQCKAKAPVGQGCTKDAYCTTGMCVSGKCKDKQPAGASCGAPRECLSFNCEAGKCAKPQGKQLQERYTKKCIADTGGQLNYKPCNKGDPSQLWGEAAGGVLQNSKTGKCMTVGSYAC